mmetsp:Transcript_41572/g.124319  ORF Transcript_41572/g.124319 Transcript_41572/m.124319 type:complete len:174 (+) Transcript_41572:977-1498(+)
MCCTPSQRLSTSGYKTLCEGLARTCTLRRLSLAGSHLGDANMLLLQEGLEKNCSLEELDLTACGLSDVGAACVASVIKRHADRRVDMAFHRHLREYPDLSLGEARAQATHRHALHQAARDVDAACGGIMHVELAENEVRLSTLEMHVYFNPLSTQFQQIACEMCILRSGTIAH